MSERKTPTPTLDWFFRQAWRWACGLPEEPFERLPDLEELRRTEFNHAFIRLMQNRLIIGAFRYGRFGPAKADYDLLAGIEKKIVEYRTTGNTEALVDAANYCLLEFTYPHHPNAHFRPMDDHVHCPLLVEPPAARWDRWSGVHDHDRREPLL